MNTTLVWCVVGLVAGGLACLAMQQQGFVHRAETIAVAVFGACIGGDFLGDAIGAAPAAAAAGDGFRITSLAFAVVGALVMLGLLALMRGKVGPMRPHKIPRRR